MNSFVLAVATADGTRLCDHLARSSAFHVLEIADGKVASRSIRPRQTDACGSHKSFVEILAGCHAVLCGGIGQGAADSLAAHGIESLVVAERCSVDQAVEWYLAGKLATNTERVCLCKHE